MRSSRPSGSAATSSGAITLMRGLPAKRAAIAARTLGAASQSVTSAATAATRSAWMASPLP